MTNEELKAGFDKMIDRFKYDISHRRLRLYPDPKFMKETKEERYKIKYVSDTKHHITCDITTDILKDEDGIVKIKESVSRILFMPKGNDVNACLTIDIVFEGNTNVKNIRPVIMSVDKDIIHERFIMKSFCDSIETVTKVYEFAENIIKTKIIKGEKVND